MTNIDQYESVRVFVAKNTGNLILALPIYASETKIVLEKDTAKLLSSKEDASFGVFAPVGFVLYSPSTGELVMNNKIFDFVEDLGEL